MGDYVCNMCGKQFMAKTVTTTGQATRQLSLIAMSVTNYSETKSTWHLAVHISVKHAAKKSNLRADKKRVYEKTIDAIPLKLVCGL